MKIKGIITHLKASKCAGFYRANLNRNSGSTLQLLQLPLEHLYRGDMDKTKHFKEVPVGR